MRIRAYEEKDFPGIVEVIRETQVIDCWPKVFPNGWDEKRVREEFSPLMGYKDSLFLVAEDNDVVGLIAAHSLIPFVQLEIPHLQKKFVNLPLSYYQRDLILAPRVQRGFLGLRLFNEMRRFAVDKGYKTLVTRTPPLNLRGMAFFDRIGYREIFRDNSPERVYFQMELKNEN